MMFRILCSLLFLAATCGLALPTNAQANKPRPPESKAPTTTQSPTIQKVRTWLYNLEFRGSKVGQMKQTETTYSNGIMVVEMNSESTIRILFSTAKNKTHSHTTYRHGQFQSLVMEGMQRGNQIKVDAKRTTNGIKVILTKNKKTTETFHPVASFQATSADLHFPLHKQGWKNTRKLLRLDEQKVVDQRVHYGKMVKQPWKGKSIQLQEVTVQGPQGKAHMLFTEKGRMFQMEAKISIFGSFRISLHDRR